LVLQALKREAQTADLSARTLVSARMEAWQAGYPFPLAQVRSSLGQAGDLASETAALLAMEGVRDDDQFSPEVGAYARVGQGRLPPRPAHPGPACAVDVPPPCLHLACTLPPLPQVLACLPPTPWCIGDEELAARRDFRAARVFSIDPPTARDLDDALSVEELPGGGYRVGVHIADVSHFVQPGTALDREAQERSTSGKRAGWTAGARGEGEPGALVCGHGRGCTHWFCPGV
jgi:DIS3-like exonuclease 2